MERKNVLGKAWHSMKLELRRKIWNMEKMNSKIIWSNRGYCFLQLYNNYEMHQDVRSKTSNPRARYWNLVPWTQIQEPTSQDLTPEIQNPGLATQDRGPSAYYPWPSFRFYIAYWIMLARMKFVIRQYS